MDAIARSLIHPPMSGRYKRKAYTPEETNVKKSGKPDCYTQLGMRLDDGIQFLKRKVAIFVKVSLCDQLPRTLYPELRAF